MHFCHFLELFTFDWRVNSYIFFISDSYIFFIFASSNSCVILLTVVLYYLQLCYITYLCYTTYSLETCYSYWGSIKHIYISILIFHNINPNHNNIHHTNNHNNNTHNNYHIHHNNNTHQFTHGMDKLQKSIWPCSTAG